MKSINRFTGVFLLWITSYVFFLATMVNNLSASHDSIHYLVGIVRGEQLFHPHHLLYHFLARQWLVIFSAVFPGAGAHHIIQSFTALWGSSAVVAIYLFFRNRFRLGPTQALLSLCPIVFSYGFWFYSVNIEVYLPPLFFMICTLYVMSSARFTSANTWKGGLLHAVAILFHQVNVLFMVTAVYLLVKRKSPGGKTGLAGYLFTTISIVGAAYFLGGWVMEGNNTPALWIRWAEGYAVGHDYWQVPGWDTPIKAIVGFARAFFGGHYFFQLPGVQEFLQAAFAGHGLRDENFLARHISPALAWTLAAVTVLAMALIAGMAWKCLSMRRQLRERYTVVAPMVLTILVYSVFFCFWMPEILEFWILQMVLTWMLLLGVYPAAGPLWKPGPRGMAIALALAMLLVNYEGSMRWLRSFSNDWYHVELQQIKEPIGSDDLVIVEQQWLMKDYFRYYTEARVVATDEPGFDRARTSELVQEVISAGGKVYLYRGMETAGPRGMFIQSY